MKVNRIFLHRSSPVINEGTPGTLRVGERYFYTLEPLRPIIPKGTYNLILTYSPRFHRSLPLITPVQGHSGVRIHCGNTLLDTHGCILVGTYYANGFLHCSKNALSLLLDLVSFPATLVVK